MFNRKQKVSSMSKESTFKKISKDITEGNIGKARDRLHGLISTYPNDLELRTKLAEIYHKLQLPEMAGRYWYLEENKTEEMKAACLIFEKSCRNHLREALKFRGNINKIDSVFAKEKLLSLGYNPDYGASGKKQSIPIGYHNREEVVILTILALVALSAIVGFITIIKWLYRISIG